MRLRTSRNIYNPVEHSRFIVRFDNNTDEQQERANKVIAHLNTVSSKALVDESVDFFNWVVLFPPTECNRHYAIRLLEYFHSRNMLLHKEHVANPTKQKTERYLVMFTMNDQIFTRTYNSVRELKADTGKKPSQLVRTPTQEAVCKILKHNLSEYDNTISE